MIPATPEKEDFWTLLHDLLFGIPTSVLAVVEYAIALLVLGALVGCVLRIWKGDRFELGPLKLEGAGALQGLQDALRELSNDDKLKANVLWIFRDRLNEASRIVRDGVDAASVRVWCGNVLTDVATALSRGGFDRHRTSLWIRSGDLLRMYNAVGFRQLAVDEATLPLDSIAGKVFQSGATYRSGDVDADRAFHPKARSGRAYRSLLSVPIKWPGGTTIAALCVDAESRGYFDADDEFFAGCFADLIALLLAQVLPETNDE